MKKQGATDANFFCLLGLPKSGTTWLAEYLRTHPSVFVPVIKELQLFSRRFRPDLYRWMDDLFKKNLIRVVRNFPTKPGAGESQIELLRLLSDVFSVPCLKEDESFIEAYRSIFYPHLNSSIVAFGELSTTYCTLTENHLRLLDSCFSNTKYILVLRDPATRFWSHINHKAKYFDSDPIAEVDRWLLDPELTEIADYRKTLGRIFSVIPKERVLVLFYEDLFRENDDSALRVLCDYLGVEYLGTDRSEVIYKGGGFQLPDELAGKIRDCVEDSYEYTATHISTLPEGWEART